MPTTNVNEAPARLPQLADVEAVAVARKRRDDLAEELRKTRLELEGVGKIDPTEAAALALAGDNSAAKRLERMVELKAREPVLTRAVELTTEAVDKAEREAIRALTPAARAVRLDSASKAMAVAYLNFVVAVDNERSAVRELQVAGYGVGGVFTLPRNPPSLLEYDQGTTAHLRSLIAAGLLSRDEVTTRLPQVVAWGWLS